MAGCSRRSGCSKTVEDVAPVVAAELLQFDVPVAELVPEEVPEGLGGFVIAVVVDGAVHVARRTGSGARRSSGLRDRVRRERPSGMDGCSAAASASRSMFMNMKRAAFQILLAKAREVPCALR